MDEEERRRQEIINEIPEFSVIERQKENVMPRREGRSVVSLSSVLQTSAEEREQQLQQRHEEFAREMEDLDNLYDPLDVFIRYIDWTTQMYPEGHNQYSDLRGLLEETTSRFQQEPLYKNDVRYLKSWLQYIEYLDDPGEAYQLLARNGIGQNSALYYVEYANFLETRRRYNEANTVYQRGIERNAQPVTRLARHQAHFLARVERQRDEELRARVQRQSASNSRTILGLKYDGTHSMHPPTSSSSLHNSHISRTPRHQQFSVYTGPELDDPNPSAPSSSTHINNPSQRRENQTPVSKFAGTTLPQKPYKRIKHSSFTVFRDDDNDSSENTSSSITLSDRSIIPVPRTSNLQVRFNKFRSKYISSKDSRGRVEYIAAFKDCLNGKSEPLSFEEIHARAIMKRMEEAENITKKLVPQTSEAPKNDSIPSRSSTPDSFTNMTQETRAAWLSINALAAGGKDVPVMDEEEEPLSFNKMNIKRHIVDENDVPNRRVSMEMPRQGASFYDSMDTFDTDDDEDTETDQQIQIQPEETKNPLPYKRPFPNH